MAAKKRGLGRGLDALLGPAKSAAPAAAASATATVTSTPAAAVSPEGVEGDLRTLGVERLRRGKYQPRVDMHNDSLEDLADSIRAQGVVQPIVVRPVEGGDYEIIAGERRWRAAQLAGLQEVPVVIRDMDDRAAIAVALIENIQREDLNPIEEAVALQRLIEEFDMTHQEAAGAVGRSRAAVSNLLRLLTLNSDVRKLLEHGDLEMGHARALLALEGEHQSQTAREVAAKGYSVRETEQLVRRVSTTSTLKPKKAAKDIDPDIKRLQDDLMEKLSARVAFQHTAKGNGKLVIQ